MPTVKVRTKQNQKKVSKKHLKKNDNNVDKLTGSRLKSSEFSKVEDELIQTVDKLSRVGLQEYATYLSHPFGRIYSRVQHEDLDFCSVRLLFWQ